MAPLIKQESSTSPPPRPDILIPAPAAIDFQPKESLEDGYESDKDLQAHICKQKSRSRASTDGSDSESESGYAIDVGDIILEHVVDHNKLPLGESDVQLNAELQALAVDKDNTDYD